MSSPSLPLVHLDGQFMGAGAAVCTASPRQASVLGGGSRYQSDANVKCDSASGKEVHLQRPVQG